MAYKVKEGLNKLATLEAVKNAIATALKGFSRIDSSGESKFPLGFKGKGVIIGYVLPADEEQKQFLVICRFKANHEGKEITDSFASFGKVPAEGTTVDFEVKDIKGVKRNVQTLAVASNESAPAPQVAEEVTI